MIKRRSLINLLFLLISGLVVAIVVPLGFFWISGHVENFDIQADTMRQDYVKLQKEIIKNQVKNVIQLIQQTRQQTESRLKATLKERVETAHASLLNIYLKYQGKMRKEEIQELIKEILRPIRYDNNRGYYFIVKMDGTELLYPPFPEYEDKNIIDLQDSSGRFVIQEEIALIKEHNEGFIIGHWKKPNSKNGKLYKKISYIKAFKPYDWYLGTGEYLDDVEVGVQEELLDWVNKIRVEKNASICIHSYDGIPLISKGQRIYDGKSQWEIEDPQGVKIIQEQRKSVKNPKGDFIYYESIKTGESSPSPKVSFIMGVPQWQWMVEAGVHYDQIGKEIQERRLVMQKYLFTRIIESLLILAVLLLIVIIIIKFFYVRLRYSINSFTDFFQKAAQESTKINMENIYFKEFTSLATAANKMVQERFEALEELQKSLAMKEMLIKEIQHRTKNTLTLMGSLINLQKSHTSNEECQLNFKNLQQRIQSIAMVYQNLHQGADLIHINIGVYLNELTTNIMNFFHRDDIQLIQELENIELDSKTAISLGLIVNELITNAVKYSFPDDTGGVVSISMRRTPREISLVIKNNGIPFPAEIDFRKSPSLGLNLVCALVSQIDGQIDMHREKGTEFLITFT